MAAVGWTLSAWLKSPPLFVLALALVQMGTLSMLPTFWSLPTAFLSGTAAAGGIALINSIGNLGGFVGPNIIGQLYGLTGTFTSGLLSMAAIMVAGGVLALLVKAEQ